MLPRTAASSAAEPQECFVWICDEDLARRKAILNHLRGIHCVVLNELASYREPVLTSSTRGAVLLIAEEVVSHSELKFISNLREICHFVLCITTHSRDAGLATSCKLLLAGATDVMNAHDDDFPRQFRAQIERLARRALATQAEEETLHAMMSSVGFAGQSAAVLSLFRTLRSVSCLTDLPALITGETGTGKELVASAIHSLDPKRSCKPFVALNCGALPEQLSESELFGHQRGAFTGADRERAGMFRSAHQGVLFLDEVGELSNNLQSKLLRVLQTNRLRSVGADHEITVDVRVIAATNRNLSKMVNIGAFREDLFHRLNVLALHIPPLRERTADIPVLVQHFLEKYRALWKAKRAPLIGNDFLQGLERSRLPGNVRQLENMVRRALIEMDESDVLSLRHLPPAIWQEVSETVDAEHSTGLPAPVHKGISDIPLEAHAVEYLQRHDWNLPHTTRYLESLLVRGALTAAKGNQSEAARLLGITARSVYNKLHQSYSS
jgi:transcriptional regulator with GAF, ATPase, and Fis domain